MASDLARVAFVSRFRLFINIGKMVADASVLSVCAMRLTASTISTAVKDRETVDLVGDYQRAPIRSEI